jgi:hypothetical protein
MEELKLCPFCGVKPDIWVGEWEPQRWYIQCPECHIFRYGITKEEAVKNWNKRAN